MSDTDERDFEDIFAADDDSEAPSSVDDEDADGFFSEIDGEEVEDNTSAHKATVSIAGKTYAVGLFWKSSEDPKRVAKEAVAYSKSDGIGADLYCVRSGEAVQFGLGHKERGHKAGMPSLAASIDEGLTGDWLAAFYVGGSYYVAAVRRGLILSERDQIYVVEEDAKTIFMELYYGASWDEVICPESWGLSSEEAREESIEDAVYGNSAGKLKPTNPLASILKFAVVLALLGGIGFAGNMFYQDYLEKERAAAIEAARDAAKKAAEAVGQKSIGQRAQEEVEKALMAVEDTVAPILGMEPRARDQQQPDIPPPAPWKGRRNGTGMLIACVQDAMKAPMDVPGWETSQISCTETNIQVTLNKAGGTALWAEKHLKKNGFPDVDFRRNSGAQSLFVSYLPSYVSEYGETLADQPVEDVINYVREHFAELDIPVEAMLQPDNPSNRRSRFFKEGSISFQTEMKPDEFANLFSKIKGFVVEGVTLDIGRSTWTVRGAVYERRAVPLPRPDPQQ